MNDKYISVSQLTRYIKYKIDNDVNLNEVFLKGEISNFKAHSRGHFYFTLKDEGSRINAIMFASQTKKIKFVPQDGMKVLVTGKISVFEANGGYQIYVNEMLEDGVGNLYIAYEQLKKKLENEGLFNKDHKKEIPHIPKSRSSNCTNWCCYKRYNIYYKKKMASNRNLFISIPCPRRRCQRRHCKANKKSRKLLFTT